MTTKQKHPEETTASPFAIIFVVCAFVFAFYFFMQFLMQGVLVEIEEKREFGSGVYSEMECNFAEVANWITGGNVPCVPTKVSKTD